MNAGREHARWPWPPRRTAAEPASVRQGLTRQPLLRLLFVLLAAAGLMFANGCAPVVVEHSAAVSEANALIVEVQVSLSRSARVFVEYDNPFAGRYRTALGAAAKEHAIPVVRLRAETTYDYAVFTVDGSDVSNAVRGPGGSFTTGALPASFAPIFTTAAGRSSQPLILTDYAKEYVFFDEMGALVWYLPVANSGAVARLPGQEDFLSLSGRLWESHLSQFTPLGEVTDVPGDFALAHHEVAFIDDARALMPMTQTLVHDDAGNDDPRKFRYDILGVWHSGTGRVEQVWSAKETWDILDPAQHWKPALDASGLPVGNVDSEGFTNWIHINSVSFGPHGNIVLSLRNRNQIIALDPDYKIAWQLHGPDSDYQFPDPADRFYRQHTAAQLANGNILLFDNGNARPDAEGGVYSRALELRLDDEEGGGGTAVKVWEYRPAPDIYSPYVGSAYRLNNGNTLVNFGVRVNRHGPLVVVEADPNGEEVFRIETALLFASAEERKRTLYRSYRAYAGIEAIHGETMLRPPAARVDSLDERLAMHYGRMARVATGPFELYLEDGFLVYAKKACEAADMALPFFAHVYPKERQDLPADQRKVGFESLGFKFNDTHEGRGLWPLVRQGRCHAMLRLPEYEIDHIKTGQLVAEGETTTVASARNESSASVPWSVEIRLPVPSDPAPAGPP